MTEPVVRFMRVCPHCQKSGINMLTAGGLVCCLSCGMADEASKNQKIAGILSMIRGVSELIVNARKTKDLSGDSFTGIVKEQIGKAMQKLEEDKK